MRFEETTIGATLLLYSRRLVSPLRKFLSFNFFVLAHQYAGRFLSYKCFKRNSDLYPGNLSMRNYQNISLWKVCLSFLTLGIEYLQQNSFIVRPTI
uniref:Putative ovule protein n=1 Tax=Solanum chacoense TaxID=4108 RepID=A0A0V0GU92_SOLCH